MSKLTDKFKNPNIPLEKSRDTPVWKGPCEDGVTFSQLNRFLSCRERFRVYVVEGLRSRERFIPALHYGNMWHEAEEGYAKDGKWEQKVTVYAEKLSKQFPFQRDEVVHWYSMLLVQFPEYCKYWEQHDDMKNRRPLEQEQVFNIGHKLPSGRVVKLRGKRDSVDLVGNDIWLQENKSKSQIDQQKISRQLIADLQTMMYLISLQVEGKYKQKVKGVRYNVVRRSAHKTAQSMQKKMLEDIADNRGQEWFSRWNVEVTSNDIEEFKVKTLNPMLEQLCDWWEWIEYCTKIGYPPFAKEGLSTSRGLHWQTPYGLYNVLTEGGSTDYDSYLSSGSTVGLERTDNLYPELTE